MGNTLICRIVSPVTEIINHHHTISKLVMILVKLPYSFVGLLDFGMWWINTVRQTRSGENYVGSSKADETHLSLHVMVMCIEHNLKTFYKLRWSEKWDNTAKPTGNYNQCWWINKHRIHRTD